MKIRTLDKDNFQFVLRKKRPSPWMGPVRVTTYEPGISTQEFTFPTTKAASIATGVPTNILSAIRLNKTNKTYDSRLGKIVFVSAA